MFKQIKYFQSVVQCGSFTAAAEQCYISQSAISQQVQALEQELGVRLLDRSGRRVSLTAAGEHFYQKSLVLTADLEKLCRETARIAGEGTARLRIGYLRCYGGQELQRAIARFSEVHPGVDIEVVNGNHEELYDALRFGRVDLVLNDQRRAFSDEYVNFILTVSELYIEISERNPISRLESVTAAELKNIPCVLVASAQQQENERTYYRDIVGLQGDFVFAENLEEARLLVVGGRGYLPIEGGESEMRYGASLHRMPLRRGGNPIKRVYGAFWKADSSTKYIEGFAEILKSNFPQE